MMIDAKTLERTEADHEARLAAVVRERNAARAETERLRATLAEIAEAGRAYREASDALDAAETRMEVAGIAAEDARRNLGGTAYVEARAVWRDASRAAGDAVRAKFNALASLLSLARAALDGRGGR
jgi:hypothetical protein